MSSDYEKEEEFDGPGGRGPLPVPPSKFHADLFPEIQILGGTYQFAHDAGMIYGSPKWFVGGKEVEQRDILYEIYKYRGIDDSQREKAAEIAKDFVLAWRIYDCVLTKPDCWDKSEVLKNVEYTEPYVEIIDNPKQQNSNSKSYGWDITVAQITYWSCKDKNNQPTSSNNSRMMEAPITIHPSSVEHWKTWELKFFDVGISTYKSGEYESYSFK